MISPEAYLRERTLMPFIMDMEGRGIKLDGLNLAKDIDTFMGIMDRLDEVIGKRVDQPGLDVDSSRDLAYAIKRKYGDAAVFRQTDKTQQMSTAKDSLIGAITGLDNQLLGHLLIRGSIATCLRTFMQPWLTQYNENKGRLYMQWNQIRNYTDTGARTGRISSSPNLQNIPVEWEELIAQLKAIKYDFDTYIFDKEVKHYHDALPQVRKYILPDDGMVLIGRDFSAQEMKLLAYFTKGRLLEEVVKEPGKDIHQIAAGIAGVTRKVAKTLGFAVLYGAGVKRIAESLDITVAQSTSVKSRFLAALPEIKTFQDTNTRNGSMGKYTDTIGGRFYTSAPSKLINGHHRTMEYKITNYKIQGSAADQTKEAMILYYQKKVHGDLLLTVHDQLVMQVPIQYAETERYLLKEAMDEAFKHKLGDLQIISDGSYGPNFADMYELPDDKPIPAPWEHPGNRVNPSEAIARDIGESSNTRYLEGRS